MSQIQTLKGILADGQPIPLQVFSATITKTVGEHDSALLYANSGSQIFDYTTLGGERVEFIFGDSGTEEVFRGYVGDVSPVRKVTNGIQFNGEEIFCIGPSMVFKGNTPRFFTEVTATEAIARIVTSKQLGFSDEFKKDSYVWRTLAQTEETDWEMITALANRLPAQVLVTKGVVRLIDHNEIMSRQLPSLSFVPSTQSARTDNQVRGNMMSFSMSNAAGRDPSYSTPQIAYLAGGRAVTVQAGRELLSQQAPTSFATRMPALSVLEAEKLQAGFYNPDWPEDASVTVVGDATINPGITIYLSSTTGIRSGNLPSYDGIWYVQKVSHTLDRTSFKTALSLTRQRTREPNVYAERAFWQGDRRGVPSLSSSGTGAWISTWRQ